MSDRAGPQIIVETATAKKKRLHPRRMTPLERTRANPEPLPERNLRQRLEGSPCTFRYCRLDGSHWDDDGIVMDVSKGWSTARAEIIHGLVLWIDGQELTEPTRYAPDVTIGDQLVLVAENATAAVWERLGWSGDPEAVDEEESPAETQMDAVREVLGRQWCAWRDGLLRDLAAVTGRYMSEMGDDELKTTWRHWFA